MQPTPLLYDGPTTTLSWSFCPSTFSSAKQWVNLHWYPQYPQPLPNIMTLNACTTSSSVSQHMGKGHCESRTGDSVPEHVLILAMSFWNGGTKLSKMFLQKVLAVAKVDRLFKIQLFLFACVKSRRSSMPPAHFSTAARTSLQHSSRAACSRPLRGGAVAVAL